ncbi:hypothetical protein Q3G72_011709 [Acer saccharum]|nr:hypothetical protein Q3G72_011709 [Acer saccharum]
MLKMERDMQEMVKREKEETKRDMQENAKREKEEMKRDMQEIVKREKEEMKRDMQEIVKREIEEVLKRYLFQTSSTQGEPADMNENPRTPYFFLDHQNRKSEEVEFQTYELEFVNKLHNTIFTKDKITDENGGFVEIKLIDSSSRQIIDKGTHSSMEIKIHVLDGDFGSKANDNWTEEFNAKIVCSRERKELVVKGKQNITLKNGVGTMDDLRFFDNSSWTKCKKFRLGARALQSTSNMGQVRIKEAITQPFAVRDHRGKIKHLKKIVEGGIILHEALIRHNICTDSALKQRYKTNRDELKEILKNCSDSEWAAIAQYASCVGDDANSNPSLPSQVTEAYNPAITGMQTERNRASSSHHNSESQPEIVKNLASHRPLSTIGDLGSGFSYNVVPPRIISSESESSSNNNGPQAHSSAAPHTPNNVMPSVNAENMITFPGVNPSAYYSISNQNNNGTQAHLYAERHTFFGDFSIPIDQLPSPEFQNETMVD